MHIPRSAVRAFVRAVIHPLLSTRFSPPLQRRVLDTLSRGALLPRGTQVSRELLGDRPAERIVPPGGGGGAVVLYLHGGAYSVGSPITHRGLAGHLAESSGAAVFTLDYRRAPEHPYPAAVEDTLAAYTELLGGDRPVAVAGDCAGGGLALALCLRGRQVGLPLPPALGLISPWVDLTLASTHDDPRDPYLTRAWLERSARDYAGEDRERPEVSPLYADLTGLPPMLIQGASDEILLGDIERLVERAELVGVEVTYSLLDQMWHDGHLYAGVMKEGKEAVAEVGEFLRRSFSP